MRIQYCGVLCDAYFQEYFLCMKLYSQLVGSSHVTRIFNDISWSAFRISNSSSFGLVVNLYQDDTMNLLIGALLLNPEDRLSDRAKLSAISRLASILLEDFAIGSILSTG